MPEDEARERARKKLEERQARMRGGKGGSAKAGAREPVTSGRPRSSRPGSGNRRSGEARSADPLSALFGAATSAARAIGRARLAAGLAAVAALVALVVGIRGCLGAPPVDEPRVDAPAPASVEGSPSEAVDEDALATILGDDAAARLVQAAATDGDAAWIAAHPDAYAMDGEAVQRKLLKLAAEEPEARPFVRGFPDSYPADAAGACDPVGRGVVPRLYQWDPRWGCTVYSSTTFALTGCCPTSLAMVYQGLTGRNDLSPYDLGVRAREGGYMALYDGTDASYLVNEAAALGLSCESLPVSAASLRAALGEGAVVICNVGPGDFTENGHFFVVTGIDGDGRLSINDPYSAERSNRTWDVGAVIGQTKALWAYRAA